MEQKKYWLIYLLVLTCLVSCEYNVEEDLYPQNECDTLQVTYAATIVPILTMHCYECHAMTLPLSGIPLEGHANIKAQVDGGRLIGAIRHLSGFSPMPKDRGFLPECDILQIEKWVADGAPNN